MTKPLFQIERRLEIDAAHRATYTDSKCANLHGHRYAIIVSCVGPLIEEGPHRGMVLDFVDLKKMMVEEIDAPCDHATLLWVDDPLTATFVGDSALLDSKVRPAIAAQGYCRISDGLTGTLYILPTIPTAENLAAHWYERLRPRIETLGDGRVTLRQVKVYESPQCCAAYPAL